MKSDQPVRLVFMGSPDFAVASADALLQAGCEIASVVTVPDKPAGRGMRVRKSAVKLWAEEQDLPVLQPENLRDPEFLSALHAANADLFVVVAFRILPVEVFGIPRLGTMNLHASLLPKFRGAAPINWALIEGEQETGVTTFLIDEKVDTGALLLQEKTAIAPDEDFGELYGRLKTIGADLLVESVLGIASGKLVSTPQEGEATRAPKLKPELGEIDWQQTAQKINNLIRGLAPRPAAYTWLDGKRVKIFKARAMADSHDTDPGQVLEAEAAEGRLIVACGSSALQILELQMEGKRRMQVADFLRGMRLQTGAQFG